MKNLLKILLGGLFLCSFYAVNAVAKDVNVAFFLEWATPNQEAKVNKAYDDYKMNVTLYFLEIQYHHTYQHYQML